MSFGITSASDVALSAARDGSAAGAGASHVGVHPAATEAREAENSWSELAASRDNQQEPALQNARSEAPQPALPDQEAREAEAVWARPEEVIQHQAPQEDAAALDGPAGSVGPSRDLAPPVNLSQEPDIDSKLTQHGTPEMRQKLDNVNDVVRQQYALLEPEVQAGLKQGANKEKRITAANAGSTINHINDAVGNLRSSIAAARTPEDLSKAISEYGKQSSMIGGSLGKTVMGASTLGVRQRSLQVAIAGGIGVGIAGIVPGVVSAVNSSRTANNTSGDNNGNTPNG